MQAAAPFPRHIAVLILATLACSFAGNHIAARIAFDHDTGLLLAMLCRAGVTLVVLAALVFWRRESLRLSPATWRWQLLLGLLIAVQSFCIYSAVARIPVALALLVVNLSPILLALLTWVLGGPQPTHQALAIMGLILFGLVPKMGAAVESLPTSVLGGAGLVMFGMVAATGIRILSTVDFAGNRNNLFVVAVSLGFGMIPLIAPDFKQWMPHAIHPLIESGILLATIAAVTLNAFFNGTGGNSVEDARRAASMADH